MLNTKEMSIGSGKARPLLGPGNHEIRINSITFDQTPYDKDAFNVHLHVEGKPVGGDFEGFFRDKDNEASGRYEGQIGRVRVSPYPYKDTTLPSGREIKRDQEVLKAMIFIGEVLDLRDDLDSIEAVTIEQFMTNVNTLFTNGGKGSAWFNSCLASREWENKEGYINNDLYFPKLSREGLPAEGLNQENSRLLKFDAGVHVKPFIKKNPADSNGTTNKFEPATTNNGSDFDL